MLGRTLEDFKKSGLTIWDFFEKVKDLQFKQIRVLTICDYHVIRDSYTIDRLCQLFPCIERLHVSIERIDNIIQFIDSLEYLSSVSFNLKFLSNNELIINRMEESILSTFTYRFDGSCLHMWIKKEVSIECINLILIHFIIERNYFKK